jgi:ERCC4-type nuclease
LCFAVFNQYQSFQPCFSPFALCHANELNRFNTNGVHRHNRLIELSKRGKKRTTSALEGIEGIGKARRTALLNHFGGLQELKQASVEEMQKVNGISLTLQNHQSNLDEVE